MLYSLQKTRRKSSIFWQLCTCLFWYKGSWTHVLWSRKERKRPNILIEGIQNLNTGDQPWKAQIPILIFCLKIHQFWAFVLQKSTKTLRKTLGMRVRLYLLSVFARAAKTVLLFCHLKFLLLGSWCCQGGKISQSYKFQSLKRKKKTKKKVDDQSSPSLIGTSAASEAPLAFSLLRQNNIHILQANSAISWPSAAEWNKQEAPLDGQVLAIGCENLSLSTSLSDYRWVPLNPNRQHQVKILLNWGEFQIKCADNTWEL